MPHSPDSYWGVCCRTCDDLIAFDSPPYRRFALGRINLRPGAIRCARGHTHIYFPRDFRFFSSEIPIPESVMEENCAAYCKTNPCAEIRPKKYG